MANRATQIVNFYESTLASSLIGASGTGTTLAQAPTTDGASSISATLGDENTWYYLVVSPDTAGSREVIVVKASSGTTITNVGRDIEGRYASTALPEHTSGTIVRMAVVASHIDDQNDRVAGILTEGQAAIDAITASSATAMIDGATDGTAITVDVAADYALIYDATDSTAKKVYVSQVAPPVEVHPFLIMGA
tara:strand:+ start:1741 stop:2319 length:579 start_codon:yes stop_codon:yes gene_type:complete